MRFDTIIKRVGYSFIIGVFFAGCGGGSEDTSPGSGSTGRAYYVDAPVQGVRYECGTQRGTTNSEGAFVFEKGKRCRFSVANVTLRSLEPNQLIEGGVVLETDQAVAAFLQSLDSDGNPDNGIEVDSKTTQLLKEEGVLSVPETEEALVNLIESIVKADPSSSLKAVSFSEATGHIKRTYAKLKESDVGQRLHITDENAFAQYAIGPVLYNIPVLGEELSLSHYRLVPLSDDEFNRLSEEEKYKVAIKLYGSLFYGVDTLHFQEAVASRSFISDTYALFNRPTSSSELAKVEAKTERYVGYGDAKIGGKMLARLYELTPGKAYINRWAAYILTQSILFSPAYELDTVYTVDAIDVYSDLVRDFDAGFSLQWVTFTHMMTDENWRRFRSPEDNGREMLEIYTMDFEDGHVPLAGKALQNWRLDRRSNTLVVDLNENRDPITDLFPGRTIINGIDFYSALVLQPTFVPTITRRLVDIYFPNYAQKDKERVVRQIASSRPQRFTDILKQIVFSREYLLDSQKSRSFEESFFQIAKTLGWVPKAKSFYYIARNLDAMHQSTMRYKLGRKVKVPLDSQSFAWYHKTMREQVMLNWEVNTSWTADGNGGWSLEGLFAKLPDVLISDEEFDQNHRRQELWYENERRRAYYIAKQLFIPIAGRYPTSEEKGALADLIDDRKYDSEHFDNLRWYDLYGNTKEVYDLRERGYYAQLVLNYLSRLDPVYEFEAIR